MDGRQIKLQIWDTAGQERFQSITSNYYRGSHGIALVYDITERNSFENIRKWMGEVDKRASKSVIKYIIGNKVDLEEKRAVSTHEGKSLAQSLGVQFLETSAKQATNVNRMFTEMSASILRELSTNEFHDIRGTADSWSINKQGIQTNSSSTCSC